MTPNLSTRLDVKRTLLLVILLVPMQCCDCSDNNAYQRDHSRLIKEEYTRLTKQDSMLLPPNPHLNEKRMRLDFKLYHIVDVDDTSQTMKIKAKIAYTWYDTRL